MLRHILLSTTAVALLFVTANAHAQSGSRGAAPSFSAPVQSAPAIGGAGSSFGARQTFSQPAPVYSQPAPVYSQPAPVVSGSGTAIRSTAPSSVVTNPLPVYSQPVYSSQPSVVSSSSCCGSAPVIQSAPVFQSAPIIQSAPPVYFPPARRCCGCRGF